MKGDFTRFTFNPTRHYSTVLLQQGRCQIDADWNEQQDLTLHRTETGTFDTLGPCGVPMHDDGFRIAATAADLTTIEQARPGNQTPPALNGAGDFYLTAGRAYVGGALCENERIVPFTRQPDLPGTIAVATPGTYLAWLDVWPRHITALEDPTLREVALGGPDHATRVQNVWQVKLFRLGDATLTDAQANCALPLVNWETSPEVAAPTGGLAAQAEEDPISRDPCILAPGAGYRRLENQLYRVEVHRGGPLGTATFKWSRDNGSIVSRWESQDGASNERLTVSSTGRDQFLNFATGQWIELTDDNRERLGTPGPLVQIGKVEGQVITVKPETAIDPASGNTVANAAAGATLIALTGFAGTANPKVRRWDHVVLLRPTNSTLWHGLEDGVEVRFGVVTSGTATYRSGDYWLIPARTATPFIEWPASVSDPNEPALLPPHGIPHRRCRLGILRFDGTTWSTRDCRRVFPPTTELVTLHHVSGDGQEAMPGQPLPQPLRVRVSNGEWPVAGRSVLFSVTAGGGTLTTGQPVVTVAPDGTADCSWTLGNAVSGIQRVEARLLDAAGVPVPGQVVGFDANLSLASNVAYDPGACSQLNAATTVQLALERLSQLTRLAYAGGDGQESAPGQPLPQALRVSVSNACGAVAGATVRFTASRPAARVAGTEAGLPAATVTVNVTTDATGFAECHWLLDSGAGAPASQTVIASLIATPGAPALPMAAPGSLQFTGNLEVPATGDGCDVTVGPGGDFNTLAEAFAALLDRRHLCICLLPGDHPGVDFVGGPDTSLKLTGCGMAAARIIFGGRLILDTGELILRDLSVLGLSGTDTTLELAAARITVEDCGFARSAVTGDARPFVTIRPPAEVRWAGNRMVVLRRRTTVGRFSDLIERSPNLEVRTDLERVLTLDPATAATEFDTAVTEASETITTLSAAERTRWLNRPLGVAARKPRTRRQPRRAAASLSAFTSGNLISSLGTPSLLLVNSGSISSLLTIPVTEVATDPNDPVSANPLLTAVEERFADAVATEAPVSTAVRDRLLELAAAAVDLVPADALALGSNEVGGVISGNLILGNLLLNSTSARAPEGDEWQDSVKGRRIIPGDALVVQDNQLGRIFTRLPASDLLPGHRSLQLAHNVFSQEESSVIGAMVTLSGNQFQNVASGHTALRPRADLITAVGNVAGDAKVVIGNGDVRQGREAANIADIKF